MGHCGRSGFLPSSVTSMIGGSGTGPTNIGCSSSSSPSDSYFPLYVGAGGGAPADFGGSSFSGSSNNKT